MDQDPYSKYGSGFGSTKFLHMDTILFRIYKSPFMHFVSVPCLAYRAVYQSTLFQQMQGFNYKLLYYETRNEADSF